MTKDEGVDRPLQFAPQGVGNSDRYADILKKSNLIEQKAVGDNWDNCKYSSYALDIFARMRKFLIKELGEFGSYREDLTADFLESLPKNGGSGLASEDYFCERVLDEISSMNELPQIYNQWNTKIIAPKLEPKLQEGSKLNFLQKGHTFSSSKYEAKEIAKNMAEVYQNFFAKYLSIPVIIGKNPKNSAPRYAEPSYVVAALSKNGDLITLAQSNYFGDRICKRLFNERKNQARRVDCLFETSWGVTDDLVFTLCAIHGDKNGIVVPSEIAPLQVAIIPKDNKSEDEANAIKIIFKKLKKLYRIEIAAGENFTHEIAKYEALGVPIVIELTKENLEKEDCTLTRRDTGEKVISTIEDVDLAVPLYLEKIKNNLYYSAFDRTCSMVHMCRSFDEFKCTAQNTKGIIKALVCANPACQKEIFEDTEFTPKFVFLKAEKNFSNECIVCRRKARRVLAWGKMF